MKKKKQQIKHEKEKKQKEKEKQLKQELMIRQLMEATRYHNHKKCNCEGCYWWTITSTLVQEGRMVQLIPTWKNIDRDEYLRIFQRSIQYKIDKKVNDPEKILKALEQRKIPLEKAKKIVIGLLSPIHVIMYGNAPSRFGLLIDV